MDDELLLPASKIFVGVDDDVKSVRTRLVTVNGMLQLKKSKGQLKSSRVKENERRHCR